MYQIVEIPYLSPASSNLVISSCSAAAVNDQGIVVGSCNQDCNGCAGTGFSPLANEVAWMYQESSGALTPLTFTPEDGAVATDISNSGVITGDDQGSAQSPQKPGYWTVSGGAVLLADTDFFTTAKAVNDSGTIVGSWEDSGWPGSGGDIWSAPSYAVAALPGLECDNCHKSGITVNAINDSGTAVGQSLGNVVINGAVISRGELAVEWQSGVPTSLGSLQNSGTSDADGINDDGDVVGVSDTTQPRTATHPGAFSHAFLYHQGVMSDLGTLAGDTDSEAISINDSGQIVGVSSASMGTTRAFLYQNGQMYDLNALIDATSSLSGVVQLGTAVSISANGWIVVNGTDSRDQSAHAFLLIPSS